MKYQFKLLAADADINTNGVAAPSAPEAAPVAAPAAPGFWAKVGSMAYSSLPHLGCFLAGGAVTAGGLYLAGALGSKVATPSLGVVTDTPIAPEGVGGTVLPFAANGQ